MKWFYCLCRHESQSRLVLSFALIKLYPLRSVLFPFSVLFSLNSLRRSNSGRKLDSSGVGQRKRVALVYVSRLKSLLEPSNPLLGRTMGK